MSLFNEEEIKQRSRIWVALSKLFLDTDISLLYQDIATACADSSFSLEELKNILENEVAPVCKSNLLAVTGEWTSFDEEWLVSNIQTRLEEKQAFGFPLLSSVKNYGVRSYIRNHWDKLEPVIVQKRGLFKGDNY